MVTKYRWFSWEGLKTCSDFLDRPQHIYSMKDIPTYSINIAAYIQTWTHTHIYIRIYIYVCMYFSFSTCLWTEVPNRSLVGAWNWSETSSRPSSVTSAQQRASQSCWSLLYVLVVYMLFYANLSRIFVEKLFQDSYRDWTCKKHLKH